VKNLAAHKQCTASLNKILFEDKFYNSTITSLALAKEAMAKFMANRLPPVAQLEGDSEEAEDY